MSKFKRVSLKIWLLCLLLLVVLCFSACGQVRAITIKNEDGTIDELVCISLTEDEIVEAGYDVAEFKQDIIVYGASVVKNIVNDFNTRVMLDLTANKKLIDGVYGISNNKWEGNNYIIGLRFASAEVYKYYYGITDNEELTEQREKHFLYDTVSYTSSTMFADYNGLYNSVYVDWQTKYPNLLPNEKGELIYTYVTEYRRQHSNANYITKQDGKYYHSWVVDDKNISEPVTFYYNIANRGNCILLCIGISLVVCAVLVTIGVVITQIKKHKNKKEAN